MDALAKSRITEGLVIDLGCGSGILSAAWQRSRCIDVLGIDLSEAMIAHGARAGAGRANFASSRCYGGAASIRGGRGGR